MKKLYMIGGAMGVGKTTVCKYLKEELDNSVFLDGDWCWDMSPFQVTPETKKMVMENIIFLLNNFIRCSAYENIIFCWVMHEQEIIDSLLSGLDTSECQVFPVSLVCGEDALRERLERDVKAGIRGEDVIARSLERLPLYERLDTVKVDVSRLSPEETAVKIWECGSRHVGENGRASRYVGESRRERAGHGAGYEAADTGRENGSREENLAWEEISTEHIAQDEWIDFRRSAYRFPDGRVFEPFYTYSRKDYVVIVASDAGGRYVCVRQFRQGIKEVTTEFPAGGIERTDGKEYGPGRGGVLSEDALEAARRELLEETGYVSEDWKFLLTVPSNATMADNYAYIFQADNCRKAREQDLDETEFLNVRLYSADEIEDMIYRGKFQQAVHIMAWLMTRGGHPDDF